MDLDNDTVDELPAPPRKDIPAADGKLLELAARALGARFEEVDGEGYGNLHFEDGAITYAWNPLLHSDDMLNLSAKLRIDIEWEDDSLVFANGHWSEPEGDDPASAARRAVTRAAAEIGQAMGKPD